MRINIQPIEKFEAGDGTHLDVHSVFATIQGEGPYTGCPAIFIRLSGCNLQCPACDTDYTTRRMRVSIVKLIELVQHFHHLKNRLVVITGGEPFRQNIGPLCTMLDGLGFKVQIETNGSLAPSDGLPSRVTIVCSPKAGRLNQKMEARVDCYKYVLSHTSVAMDGLPTLALGHTAIPYVARPPQGSKAQIYVQPMDAQDKIENELNLKAVVASCLKHGYTLQLQVHKLINME